MVKKKKETLFPFFTFKKKKPRVKVKIVKVLVERKTTSKQVAIKLQMRKRLTAQRVFELSNFFGQLLFLLQFE